MKKLTLCIALLIISTPIFAKETKLDTNNFICIHKDSGVTLCRNLTSLSKEKKTTEKAPLYVYKEADGTTLITDQKKN